MQIQFGAIFRESAMLDFWMACHGPPCHGNAMGRPRVMAHHDGPWRCRRRTSRRHGMTMIWRCCGTCHGIHHSTGMIGHTEGQGGCLFINDLHYLNITGYCYGLPWHDGDSWYCHVPVHGNRTEAHGPSSSSINFSMIWYRSVMASQEGPWEWYEPSWRAVSPMGL